MWRYWRAEWSRRSCRYARCRRRIVIPVVVALSPTKKRIAHELVTIARVAHLSSPLITALAHQGGPGVGPCVQRFSMMSRGERELRKEGQKWVGHVAPRTLGNRPGPWAAGRGQPRTHPTDPRTHGALLSSERTCVLAPGTGDPPAYSCTCTRCPHVPTAVLEYSAPGSIIVSKRPSRRLPTPRSLVGTRHHSTHGCLARCRMSDDDWETVRMRPDPGRARTLP